VNRLFTEGREREGKEREIDVDTSTSAFNGYTFELRSPELRTHSPEKFSASEEEGGAGYRISPAPELLNPWRFGASETGERGGKII